MSSQDLHPKSLDDISTAWMTLALAANHPGTIVSTLRATTTIHGTATKVRYELEYQSNPHSLPASLWLKGGFEAHSEERDVGNRSEALFYRDIAAGLDANVAASYFQSFGTGNDGLVLLEDLTLRNTDFCDLTKPLSVDQTAAVLDMQARYHAAHWGEQRMNKIDWLIPGGHIPESGVVEFFFSLWEASEILPRFQKVPAALRSRRDQLKPAVSRMLELNRSTACCVAHGDTHMGNLFFDGSGKPGYLDWQTVMKGSWAFDVAPLLVSALPVDLRRAHERELLAAYLDRLSRCGVTPPSFEAAWLTYRQFVIWSFMFALCPTAYQLEQNCIAVAERASAALIDLETLDALRPD